MYNCYKPNNTNIMFMTRSKTEHVHMKFIVINNTHSKIFN